MAEFNKNLEDLLYLSSAKDKIVYHLKKNYKENIHYIVEKNSQLVKKQGGHNKINYLLTESTFELIKNTYNLRNKYLVNETDCVKQINVIAMCIENQTIGFIENTYNSVCNIRRQHYIGKYRVDLYFVDYKLVIECDENNHIDRNQIDEKIREDYIISLGNKIIRFNPNETNFDLSNVLRKINVALFGNHISLNNPNILI
jgi:very-short-patch-repair endonuclease